jgi:PAS domain S-box-containing protein
MLSSPAEPDASDSRFLPAQSLRRWWRRQSPGRQDRYALLGPVAAVLLFLAAIVASFGYLRLEEMDREQEAVKRDVEYAQQRLRLRLLERQEELMRLAREASGGEVDQDEFITRAEDLISQYPELLAITWIDARRRVKASWSAPSVPINQARAANDTLGPGETDSTFGLARELLQPVYSQPLAGKEGAAPLQLHVPMVNKGQFTGVILGEYSIDGLLSYGAPVEVMARYAVSLVDGKNGLLAGTPAPARDPVTRFIFWSPQNTEYEVPVSPVGNGLLIRAQAYRTSGGVVGSGLFWLVGTLSALTAWMLIGTWRHTRRRMQAQQALVAETNFRRAMENSMPTGMRALDLQGRITYVNAAFCQMTGWAEAELLGRTAPFPYWPEEDREALIARLEEELQGRVTPGGFLLRVNRKDETRFEARIYLSPLIDAHGLQTGWMTSMTDITEPNRIREQLSASHERFTTVLEALDAAVSVAPLGSDELLFANRLYRHWFGARTGGHLLLAAQAGLAAPAPSDAAHDDVDALAGLPTGPLTSAKAGNAEIFVADLGKWLEVRSRYLNWVDGRLAQMVIATDITTRREAEALSAAQAERAQSASHLITMGEMASSMAHELNQPLTAINNYCNGMVLRVQSRQMSEKELLAALEKTARQAHRAGSIIQRIRSFVKRSAPNRGDTDVRTMIDEAAELADIELRRHNVRLSLHVATRLPRLWVDPILVEQVLVNLLKNAAESIEQGRRASAKRNVELRVLPKELDGQRVVEFAVSDSGAGLAPEVQQRLYEAFFSTKANGMGIGLNLCRSIVESHQGRIQAENIYNGPDIAGCRFSFWIPVGQPGHPPTEQATRKDPGVTA